MRWILGTVFVICVLFVLFIVYKNDSNNNNSSNNKNTSNTKDECVVLERRTLPDGAILEVVNDSCKEGLPHTTSETTIRMTHAVANSPRYDAILVHERVHLDQKRRPTFWRDLVRRIWSYEILTDPPAGLPSEWIDRRRPNPDTDQAPWALWRGRYVFFAAYNEDRRLKTASVHSWDLETRRLVPIPPEWQKQFSIDGQLPHQYEHPYELAAEFIAERSQCSAAAALAAAL